MNPFRPSARPGDSRSTSDAWFRRGGPHAAWDAWSLAQMEAECAYRSWAGAPSSQRRAHYLCYRAALEREQCAATVLRATLAALDSAA